jgi:diguanylate cyclase (GGDEF)-like protein
MLRRTWPGSIPACFVAGAIITEEAGWRNMNDNQHALLELVDKIEQLGQFQDKVDFPASIQQIWETFLEDARHLIAVEGCALFMVDEDTQEFVLTRTAPEAINVQCRKEIDLQIECGIFSWMVKRRQPAIVPALAQDHGQSVILLPLATAKRTLGMVMVLTPLKESLVTRENMRLLTVLAKQCALVMENAVLYDRLRKKKDSLEKANRQIRFLSQRDPLTGCFNRGYMNENLPREIRRALRYRRALSLALCDLDHFKAINDAHGHQAGDHVLKEFVRSVNELIRTDSDWLARYGGEEFLIVLPETGLENASRLAERLRGHLASRAFDWQGVAIALTASFGVVGFSAEQATPEVKADGILRRADENLYQAKQQGRNRVVSGPHEA